MPDYKEMYLHLFRSSERATNIQIEAQRHCEEMYINAPEHTLRVLPKQEGGKERIQVTSTPDYIEMYRHLFRETQKAVLVLMDAQTQCEAMTEDSVTLQFVPEAQPDGRNL